MTGRPIGIFRRQAHGYLIDRKAGTMTASPVRYGSWDVFCRLCHWGNGQYPVSRERAFEMAVNHLREQHGES